MDLSSGRGTSTSGSRYTYERTLHLWLYYEDQTVTGYTVHMNSEINEWERKFSLYTICISTNTHLIPRALTRIYVVTVMGQNNGMYKELLHSCNINVHMLGGYRVTRFFRKSRSSQTASRQSWMPQISNWVKLWRSCMCALYKPVSVTYTWHRIQGCHELEFCLSI